METRVLCVGFLLVEYIWCISNIQKITYLPFILFCKGIAQTSCQLDPQLYFSNESHDSNFLNERMGKTADVAYIYSLAVVLVVGILGNILVIISILRQKKLLKVYFVHRWRKSFPTGIRLDCVFGKCSESCWFAFMEHWTKNWSHFGNFAARRNRDHKETD